MRKIERKDVIMMENLLTMINKRAVFRELNAVECSAVHQARLWGDEFCRELHVEAETQLALASAKPVPVAPEPVKAKKR